MASIGTHEIQLTVGPGPYRWLEINAAIMAAVATMNGMKAENEVRAWSGSAPAYGADLFNELESTFKDLQRQAQAQREAEEARAEADKESEPEPEPRPRPSHVALDILDVLAVNARNAIQSQSRAAHMGEHGEVRIITMTRRDYECLAEALRAHDTWKAQTR